MNLIQKIVLSWGDIISHERHVPEFVSLFSGITAMILMLPSFVILMITLCFSENGMVYRFFVYAVVISSVAPIFYQYVYDWFSKTYSDAKEIRKNKDD